MSTLQYFDTQHIWHPYASSPAKVPAIIAERTHDVHIEARIPSELSAGQVTHASLIDGMSSWWAAAYGYQHPALVQAAQEQLVKMSHVMFGGITHQPAVELAQRLVELTPAGLEKVFFADSGSVAVEVAIKMALQYQQGIGEAQRDRLLTWRGGYHGDTFATMSVCDPENGMHSKWGQHVMKHIFVPKPPRRGADQQSIAEYLEVFEQAMSEQVAAVILEPICQGAGGMQFHDAAVLSGVRELCDKYGVLLIADEIATGFGRTGTAFACDAANISPDILCVGKALTGGMLTLAATLCTTAVADAISSPAGGGAIMHGPTFMANPLACAVAGAACQLFQSQDWLAEVARIESVLERNLRVLSEHPAVADVRVLGAIGVVELHEAVDMSCATKAAVEQGVWLRPFGKLVYTMPPYIASDAQVQQICTAIAAVCDTQTTTEDSGVHR